MNMNRFSRQIAMPEIGIEGQQRLFNARVLIVGVGGLGSPIALYLAAAGIGTIGLIDDDLVSLSNLQRQILYSESQIGKSKLLCAAERLRSLNSGITIIEHPYHLTEHNAEEIISTYDYIIDGCDNYSTRCTIDAVCSKLKIPYLYGAIGALEGQIALFTYQSDCSYSKLYNLFGATNANANSLQLNVLGTTPAIVGSIMAHQLLQFICNFGNPLIDTLLLIDLRTLQFNKIRL